MLVFDVTASPYNAVSDWDGSTGTDNTAKIQAAIDAADAVGGGTVYLPSALPENAGKTYMINGELTLGKHVNLIGESRVGSVITQTGGVSAIVMEVSSYGDGTLYSYHDGWYNTIAELSLNFVGTAAPGACGIKVTVDTEHPKWNSGFQNYRNIGIRNFYDGINVTNPILCRMEQVEAWQSVHNGFAITLTATGGGTSTLFVNTYAHHNGNHGYEISGNMQYVVFENTASDNNTSRGYYLHGTGTISNVVFNGTGAEKNNWNSELSYEDHDVYGEQYYFENILGLTLNSISLNVGEFDTEAENNFVTLDDVDQCSINGTYISQYPSTGYYSVLLTGSSRATATASLLRTTGGDAITGLTTLGQGSFLASTDILLASSGSAYRVFSLNAEGEMKWGDGTNVQDVTLDRSGAGVLRVTGSLGITEDVDVDGDLNVDQVLSASGATTANATSLSGDSFILGSTLKLFELTQSGAEGLILWRNGAVGLLLSNDSQTVTALKLAASTATGLDILPKAPYACRFFADSVSTRNKELQIFGYPEDSGSLDHASLQIVNATNDLKIFTNKTNSNIILTPKTNVKVEGGLDISGKNVITDTSTGTKIGTATNQKIGFFNHAPTTQPALPTDLTGVINALKALGLVASS